jgi:hypothetical protein
VGFWLPAGQHYKQGKQQQRNCKGGQ